MPLTVSGKRILKRFQKEYGKERGKSAFYATMKRHPIGTAKWHRKRLNGI